MLGGAEGKIPMGGAVAKRRGRFFYNDALPKTIIAPQNRPSQKETSIPTIHFQVQTVSFREGIWANYGGLVRELPQNPSNSSLGIYTKNAQMICYEKSDQSMIPIPFRGPEIRAKKGPQNEH